MFTLLLVGFSEIVLWRLASDNASTGFVGWVSPAVCIVAAIVFHGLELGFFRTLFLILAGTALVRQFRPRRTQVVHREGPDLPP